MSHIWIDLLNIIISVLGIYVGLRVLLFFYKRNRQKKRKTTKLDSWLRKAEVFSTSLAFVIIIAAFININFEIHALVIILLVVLTYRQIRNYVEGLFLRVHPLFAIGAMVSCGKIEGKIIRIAHLGVMLSTVAGERFVWNSSFDKSGFTILSHQIQSQKKTLYLKSEKFNKTKLMSLLFEHPVLVIGEPFHISTTNKEHVYLMEYTLEKGVLNSDMVQYLQDQGVETNNTDFA
jgi:hypothetical protein